MSTSSGLSYVDEFDSKEFLNTYFTSPEGNPNEKGVFHFYGEQLYNFYTRYNSKWDKSAARLLEFGGGPVITSLISAAPYVNKITFSAYLEDERKEVQLWKDGNSDAHDWSSHLKYAMSKVEHIEEADAWHKREELLRKRITHIVACDIHCDNPLLTEQEPFEIVSTSLCLEVACTTHTEYKAGVKKLVGLLKPGGFLLMFIVERETFYMVGKKKWSVLYTTLEQVKEALADAGMVIIVDHCDPASMEQIQHPIVADCKGFVFVAAQKVEF